MDTPPDKLNLADKCIQQAKVKKRSVSVPPADLPAETATAPPATSASSSEPPPWAQMMMGMMFGQLQKQGYESGRELRHEYEPRREYESRHSPGSSSPPQEPPSAATKRTAPDVEYPELRAWLNAIEGHPTRN